MGDGEMASQYHRAHGRNRTLKYWKLAAVWVCLQIIFFAAWAALEESHFSSGDSILVKTVPVDPRDILRGQYLRLGYEFSTQPAEGDYGNLVWVVLKPEGKFYVPVHSLKTPPADLPPDQLFIQGRSEYSRIYFGVEKYFVPEGTKTPDPKDITVRLRINNRGRARIEEVYVRGKPWPQ
ncbi:MAG: GDYXXLXY domain-containing protein [Deltaproteobacteria bacterium]|nr:GDYXXLXY domain-containing protein [Deltaproteobacteria bacterium]